MARSSSAFPTFTTLICMSVLLMAYTCNDNYQTRHLGGNTSLLLRCGTKLENAMWDGDDLQYPTRPMRPGEVAEVSRLEVRENWYLFNTAGVVTIKECGDGAP